MPRILLISLDCFSSLGGIQWYNRLFTKALGELSLVNENLQVTHLSLYDRHPNPIYTASVNFKGFSKNKAKFLMHVMREAVIADQVIFAHINLSFVLLLIRKMAWGKKLYLITHGIEVWGKLTPVQQKAMQRVDSILTVSQYTKQVLETKHQIPTQKIELLYNCLDPCFMARTQTVGEAGAKPVDWWPKNAKGLITVARFAESETGKGYWQVLEKIPELLEKIPNLVYVLVGSCTPGIKAQLLQRAADLGVEQVIYFTGPLADQDLYDLYCNASVFVMPSNKEGFGRVLVEAAWCGNAVVALEAGGAPEALLYGQIGYLLPEGISGLVPGIVSAFEQGPPLPLLPTRSLIQTHFGFETFKKRLSQILGEA